MCLFILAWQVQFHKANDEDAYIVLSVAFESNMPMPFTLTDIEPTLKLQSDAAHVVRSVTMMQFNSSC